MQWTDVFIKTEENFDTDTDTHTGRRWPCEDGQTLKLYGHEPRNNLEHIISWNRQETIFLQTLKEA